MSEHRLSHAQPVTAQRLDIVLHEAIRQHARHHNFGILDLKRILAALGEVTADYLAEVPNRAMRQPLCNRYCSELARAAEGKAAHTDTSRQPSLFRTW